MKEGIKTSYIIISNSKKMIDLRSDTVTRPSAGILERMMKARVGDMIFVEDPWINELEGDIN